MLTPEQSQFIVEVVDSLAQWPGQLRPEVLAERQRIDVIYGRDRNTDADVHRNARAEWLRHHMIELQARALPPEKTKALDTMAVMIALSAGELSEGQAAAITGLDRVDLRKGMDLARERSHWLWQEYRKTHPPRLDNPTG